METNCCLLTLAPPLGILICAYFTRRVIVSITLGIILATLIAKNFNVIAAAKLTYSCLATTLELHKFFSVQYFWDTWYLFICIFLLVLGILVVLLQHSGGANAYALRTKKYINNKKTAETSSLVLSFCLFIDDYLNSLTVGAIMHPLTDAAQVPRVKLAYLVHSLSSPLVILCPFSSWVVAILGYLRKSGIAEVSGSSTFILANPLVVYFHIIPFVFYSFILIASVWYVVQTRISFGAMKTYETIAEKTGNLFGGNEPHKYAIDEATENLPSPTTTLADFFVPIIILIACIIISMLYSGQWIYFGGKYNLTQALQNSSAARALFLGGNFALIISILFLFLRKHLKLQALPNICLTGINLMLPSIVTLILAWTFGNILTAELHTGEYLANILINSVSINLLPALLFITAFLIAFTIGTAWGTAAMLFPIAIPMVPAMLGLHHIPTLAEIPMLIPVLGAILSGCVAGNHNSPIADTTIMSATSTRTPLMEHIKTQLPYAAPVMVATAVGFYLAALLIPYGLVIACIVPILTSIVLVVVMMRGLHIIANRVCKVNLK